MYMCISDFFWGGLMQIKIPRNLVEASSCLSHSFLFLCLPRPSHTPDSKTAG